MLDEIINRLMQDEDVREIPVKYIAVFISVVSTVIRESEEEE